MTQLIGISGKKGRGKDTVFSILSQLLEDRDLVVEREGFADRLKLSAKRCFEPDAEFDPSVLQWSDYLKNHGYVQFIIEHESGVHSHTITGREFLQNYGTEAHRDVFGKDFWINAVLPEDWQDRHPDTDVLVITDVRFPNEAERVLEVGGSIWEVQRPELDKQEVADTHASEIPLPRRYIDHIIVNDSSLYALVHKVERAWDLTQKGISVA